MGGNSALHFLLLSNKPKQIPSKLNKGNYLHFLDLAQTEQFFPKSQNNEQDCVVSVPCLVKI